MLQHSCLIQWSFNIAFVRAVCESSLTRCAPCRIWLKLPVWVFWSGMERGNDWGRSWGMLVILIFAKTKIRTCLIKRCLCTIVDYSRDIKPSQATSVICQQLCEENVTKLILQSNLSFRNFIPSLFNIINFQTLGSVAVKECHWYSIRLVVRSLVRWKNVFVRKDVEHGW